MKKINKANAPIKLTNYLNLYPKNTWDQFRVNGTRLKQIKSQIKIDQAGLCAYCEIDFLPENKVGTPDFRVEHFHPKSDISMENNWHLDWSNLLGCCHGGSNPNVCDAAVRCTSPDHSCDVPKGSENMDGIILNPLSIPAFPALFSFNRFNGSMNVNKANCLEAGVMVKEAQDTIDRLRLDSSRLRRMRSGVLEEVNSELKKLIQSGLTIDQARERVIERVLIRNRQGNWPKFFTAIRVYLGKGAELHLSKIGYMG